MEDFIKFIILLPIYLIAKLVQYGAFVAILVLIGIYFKVFAENSAVFGQLVCIWLFIVIGLLTIAGFCKK